MDYKLKSFNSHMQSKSISLSPLQLTKFFSLSLISLKTRFLLDFVLKVEKIFGEKTPMGFLLKGFQKFI